MPTDQIFKALRPEYLLCMTYAHTWNISSACRQTWNQGFPFALQSTYRSMPPTQGTVYY